MILSTRLRASVGVRLFSLLLLLVSFTASTHEEVQVGYALLSAGSGGPLPVGSALFSLRNNSGVLVSEAGVGAVRLLKEGRIFVDQDGTRTGLALANPSANSVTVNLGVRDSLGNAVAQTQIILISRGSGIVRGQIEFTGTDGSPLTVEMDGVTGSVFPYQLSPNGSFRGTLTRTAGVVQGYAVVTVEPGGVAPAGTAVFQFRDSQGLLVSEAGVGATTPTSRARIFVDTAGTRTGIAVAGPEDESTKVIFELLDRHGFPIDTTSRNLPPRGQTALFADELFPDLPGGFTGLLEIRSDRPIVPVTLKLTSNARNDLIVTTLPVADLAVPASPGPLVFPQVGFGNGFSTRLILINTDLGQSISGTLEFRQSSGAGLIVPLGGASGSIFDFDLPSGGGSQLRPGNTAQPASIVIDSAASAGIEVVVNQGNQLSLSSVVIDSQGEFRDDFEFDYQSLSPEVASVDELGRITGNEVGFSTLTVRAGDAVEAATITVVGVTSGQNAFAVTGLARDLAGRTYLAGSQSHTILLSAHPGQSPEIYAGKDGTAGFRDGERLESLFSSPGFLALNQADGSLYVTDRNNNVIRKISPGLSATVETLTGRPGPGSNDGSVSQARFRNPNGVALDFRGNLWIADSGNHTIRRIDLISETVETVAGLAGTSGFQDGRGVNARFNSPTGLAIEPEPLALQLDREQGGDPPPPVSILVADRDNGVLRRVREDGEVTTLEDPRSAADQRSPSQVEISFRFDSPTAVAADSLGRIYVSEPGRDRVTLLFPSGERVPAAQPGTLQNPVGLAITESGEVAIGVGDKAFVNIAYGEPEILEPPVVEGDRIVLRGRNLSRDTTVVIPGVNVEDVQVEDTSTLSFLLGPQASLQDSLLTVLNRAGVRQRPVRVFSDGSIGDPVLGFATFYPSGLTLAPSGDILAATTGEVNRVFRVRAGTGTASRAAGNFPGSGGDGGPAKEASLDAPRGLATDRQGNLFIADSRNHRIRKVDTNAIITTVAGNGSRGFSGDNGSALQAQLDFPHGVAVDPDGNLFISDTFNNRIRRVDVESGLITTIAGDGIDQFSGDGGPAIDASLSGPQGLALDPFGNLFVTDTSNNRIRRVAASSGIISTVAGTGVAGFSGDGQSATTAQLNFPADVALDVDGNLLIADTFNNRIRSVDAQTGIITTVAGGGNSGDIPFVSYGRGQHRQDGVLADEFPLAPPVGISVDAAGNLFILGNSAGSQSFSVIRVHALTRVVTTIEIEALLAD